MFITALLVASELGKSLHPLVLSWQTAPDVPQSSSCLCSSAMAPMHGGWVGHEGPGDYVYLWVCPVIETFSFQVPLPLCALGVQNIRNCFHDIDSPGESYDPLLMSLVKSTSICVDEGKETG